VLKISMFDVYFHFLYSPVIMT